MAQNFQLHDPPHRLCKFGKRWCSFFSGRCWRSPGWTASTWWCSSPSCSRLCSLMLFCRQVLKMTGLDSQYLVVLCPGSAHWCFFAGRCWRWPGWTASTWWCFAPSCSRLCSLPWGRQRSAGPSGTQSINVQASLQCCGSGQIVPFCRIPPFLHKRCTCFFHR